jgi:hypothetical protein
MATSGTNLTKKEKHWQCWQNYTMILRRRSFYKLTSAFPVISIANIDTMAELAAKTMVKNAEKTGT